jgi:transcriptional regulator with XRE-family HTH domain
VSDDFDIDGFNEDVGRRLQFYRKAKRMTQQEMADAVGIPRATYANHETGRQRVAADLVWRVAVVLGADITNLLPEALDSAKGGERERQRSVEGRIT